MLCGGHFKLLSILISSVFYVEWQIESHVSRAERWRWGSVKCGGGLLLCVSTRRQCLSGPHTQRSTYQRYVGQPLWEERLPTERCHHLPSRQRQGEDLAFAACRGHSFKPTSCWENGCKVALKQAVWKRSHFSLPVLLLSFECVSKTLCNYCWSISRQCWHHWISLFSNCLMFCSTAALISGPGLLCTEGQTSLSRAEGEVCVSQQLSLFSFPFFCFCHSAGYPTLSYITASYL